MNLGLYFCYFIVGMEFKGVGTTRVPYLAAMILSIFVGSCGPAIAVVAIRVLAV